MIRDKIKSIKGHTVEYPIEILVNKNYGMTAHGKIKEIYSYDKHCKRSDDKQT